MKTGVEDILHVTCPKGLVETFESLKAQNEGLLRLH